MRDFTSVEVVEVEGARFAIGAVPRAVFRRFAMESREHIRKATRRALLKLRAEGVESPTEKEINDERYDADYLDAQEASQVQMIRWALRWIEKPGEPRQDVATEEAEHGGRKWKVAPLALVQEMAEDALLLAALYTAAVDKNTVTEAGRKNSPPPSPAAQGDGGATSA